MTAITNFAENKWDFKMHDTYMLLLLLHKFNPIVCGINQILSISCRTHV